MNELDWAILIVLALSTIVGVTRGVVREILSIVGWVIGIVFAIRFSAELATHIPLESLGPAVRTIIAAVVIGILVVAALALALLSGRKTRKRKDEADPFQSGRYR